MSVSRPRNILCASTVLHREHSLGDHLSSVGPDDVDTEDLVGLLLGDELDHTLAVLVGLCSRVGGEGEFSNLVLDTGSLELLLCSADPCDFGVGVDDGGDGSVVDMTVARFDVFNSGDTCTNKRSEIKERRRREKVKEITNLPPRPCEPTWVQRSHHRYT